MVVCTLHELERERGPKGKGTEAREDGAGVVILGGVDAPANYSQCYITLQHDHAPSWATQPCTPTVNARRAVQ